MTHITDEYFLKSVRSALDDGYRDILVVGTTIPYVRVLQSELAETHDPDISTRDHWKYNRGQEVRFMHEAQAYMHVRGLHMDRVLIHPFVDIRIREAVIPAESPTPRRIDEPVL